MVAMNLRNNMSTNTLHTLKKSYPQLLFTPAASFFWSPQDMAIHYNPQKLTETKGKWSLIHEVAHSLLGHTTYMTDYELLSYEVAAWNKALEIAPNYGLDIKNEHIEECLDSYRDWLYARSSCPTCKLNSIQITPDTYKCLSCFCKWRVSPSRFCRPYRLKTKNATRSYATDGV